MSELEKPKMGGRYVRNSDGSLTKVQDGGGAAPPPAPKPLLSTPPVEPEVDPADVQDDEETED